MSRRHGVSFAEISIAMLVLALALLPVFGLMTGGLVRTDASVGQTAAVELATSVMNKLLSDSLPFTQIPVSPAGQYLNPAGSVAANTNLDPIFVDAGWTTDGTARVRTRDGIQCRLSLWVGNYAADADLQWTYIANPVVDFTDAGTRFTGSLRLKAGDYDYSPYNPANGHAPAATRWCASTVSVNQWQVSPLGSTAPHDANDSLKKLVIQVAWTARSSKQRGLGQDAKAFTLISFRANLGGQ